MEAVGKKGKQQEYGNTTTVELVNATTMKVLVMASRGWQMEKVWKRMTLMVAVTKMVV